MEQQGSKNWSVEVSLVRTPDQFAMAMAVRAATFLAEEENITYFDEFDGNDYFATYFLAFVNGDPAGTIRLRFFRDFALLERVGIRKRYRSYKVFAALARASLEHARQKGYQIVAGRAKGDTHKLWRRFEARQTGPVIDMFRGQLTPVAFDLGHMPDNGHMPCGPFGDPAYENLITQIEGNWDFSKVQRPGLYLAAE
jgi:hypothetical protein